MPKSSRSSSVFFKIDPSMAGTVSVSRCTRKYVGRGTTNPVIAMPSNARPTMSQKMPETPTMPARTGPATKATMKDVPIVIPTIAIALVRLSSVVRSATNAKITDPIAPAPCSTRPTMTPSIDLDTAATALPTPNTNNPKMIIGLRPILSDRSPKGICNSPLAQSINAERETDSVRRCTRKLPGIVRKHRINHKQAEKPHREDGGKRADGAKFLSFHTPYPKTVRSRAQTLNLLWALRTLDHETYRAAASGVLRALCGKA